MSKLYFDHQNYKPFLLDPPLNPLISSTSSSSKFPKSQPQIQNLLPQHQHQLSVSASTDYEERITFLLRELESLKSYISKLEAEKGKQTRPTLISESSSVEKEELESLLRREETQKSELQMRFTALESDLLNKTKLLRELKSAYEAKALETSELSNKISFFEDFQKEKIRLESRLKDQDCKIVILMQEVERLNELTQHKALEIERIKSQFMNNEDLNIKVSRLSSEIRDWELKESLWLKEVDTHKFLIRELEEKLRNLKENPIFLKELEEKTYRLLDGERKFANLNEEYLNLKEEMKEMQEKNRENFQVMIKQALRDKEDEFMNFLKDKDHKIVELMEEINSHKDLLEKTKRNASDLHTKEEKIRENEQKILILANEIKELIDVLQRKEQEIFGIMFKIKEMENQKRGFLLNIKTLEEELRNKSIEVQQREDEIRSFQDRIRDYERSHEQLSNSDSLNRELTYKNHTLESDITNLKELLHKEQLLNQEYTYKLKRIYELESSNADLYRALEDLSNQNNEKKLLIESLSNKLSLSEQRIDSLLKEKEVLMIEKEGILNDGDKLQQYEEILALEIKELLTKLQSHEKLLDSAKETMENMHERIGKYEEVILEIPGLESQLDEQNIRVNEFMGEQQKTKEELVGLRKENKKLKEEIIRLEELGRKGENDRENDISNYNDRIKRNENKMKELDERGTALKRENEALKLQNTEFLKMLNENDANRLTEKEFRSKLEVSFTEIENLNKLLQEKDEEIALYEREKQGLIEENKLLQENLSVLKENERFLKEELYELERSLVKEKKKEKEELNSDFDARCSNYVKEIQSLNQLILKRNEEINIWRTKYSHLELLLNEFRLNENKLSNLEEKLQISEKEKKLLKTEILEASSIESYKAQIEQLTSINEHLQAQIEALKHDLDLNSAELHHYKSESSKIFYVQEGIATKDVTYYQESIKSLELMLKKEKIEKAGLSDKCGRIEKMLQEGSAKEERIGALERRIDMLMRENEEWKKRHESFQRSVEKEISKKGF